MLATKTEARTKRRGAANCTANYKHDKNCSAEINSRSSSSRFCKSDSFPFFFLLFTLGNLVCDAGFLCIWEKQQVFACIERKTEGGETEGRKKTVPQLKRSQRLGEEQRGKLMEWRLWEQCSGEKRGTSPPESFLPACQQRELQEEGKKECRTQIGNSCEISGCHSPYPRLPFLPSSTPSPA